MSLKRTRFLLNLELSLLFYLPRESLVLLTLLSNADWAMIFWARDSSRTKKDSCSGTLCLEIKLECCRYWGCFASWVKLERALGVNNPMLVANAGEMSLGFVLKGSWILVRTACDWGVKVGAGPRTVNGGYTEKYWIGFGRSIYGFCSWFTLVFVPLIGTTRIGFAVIFSYISRFTFIIYSIAKI